jgi:exodeoxyribonuclease-3
MVEKKKFKLVSWNVNGVRSIIRKGFWEWLKTTEPDMLCLQEVKAKADQIEDLFASHDYQIHWNAAQRKGYSGIAIFSRHQPHSLNHGIGNEMFDNEGRITIAEYSDFTLLNLYFPNSQHGLLRLRYKLDFCDEVLAYCNRLRAQGKKLVLCGDFNVAHTAIDLKNPKENENNPGYTAEERAWMDRFVAAGYVDIFRRRHPDEPGHYTWWTYRANARARNIGWRIDYFFVTEDLVSQVSDAYIMKEVMGSDHCPVGLEIEFMS